MKDTRSHFDFLDGRFSVAAPLRPINVFELSGFPRWETVASNVLAYFFDPNERHGLGSIFVDSLLGILNGERLVGPRGLEPTVLSAAGIVRSSEWKVVTEQATADGMRIDIYLTNDDLGVAIIIENKLDSAVDNPFESYARHAFQRYPRTVSVVLAPTRRLFETGGARWTSAAITYDQLFDLIEPEVRRMGPQADLRSINVLEQFIENTSERETKMDIEKEATVLNEFWAEVQGKEESFIQFFGALDQVNQILKARAERLRMAISQRLEDRGILTDDNFVVAGVDHKWGRREGLVAIVYLGFHLHDGPGVELMLGFTPARRQYELTIKAYPNHRKSNSCIPAFDHIPMGVTYSQADSEIVDKFFEIIESLARPLPH